MPEHHALIKNHKYVGSNNSIMAYYYLSPACDWLVERFPDWLAPNLVTFIGLMFNWIPHAWMIWQYGFGSEGEISPLMCYTIGFSYQLYLIADNCDGK